MKHRAKNQMPLPLGTPKSPRQKKREDAELHEAAIYLRKIGIHVYRAGRERSMVGGAYVSNESVILLARNEGMGRD